MKPLSDFQRACRIIALCGVVLLSFGSTFSFAAEEMKYTKDISFSVLLDTEEARAIMTKHAPDLMSNPDIEMARGMSLGDVASFPEAGLSTETVDKILVDLNKLNS